MFLEGEIEEGITALENLRRRFDGCPPESDGNDWIIDCDAQLRVRDLIDFLMPLYEKEGKAYLTIAVGCTGGHHRSVTIARCLFEHVRSQGLDVAITHRDIGRQPHKAPAREHPSENNPD